MRTCVPPHPAALAWRRWADVEPYVMRDLTAALSRVAVTHPALTLDDLDDLRQDVLLRLWRKMDRHDPSRASLRTYFSRVLPHAVFAAVQLRHERARRRPECLYGHATTDPRLQAPGDLHGLPLAEDAAYADGADRYALGQMVGATLRVITPRQRAICVGIMHGASIADLAVALGVARCTIYHDLGQVGHALLAAGLEVRHA